MEFEGSCTQNAVGLVVLKGLLFQHQLGCLDIVHPSLGAEYGSTQEWALETRTAVPIVADLCQHFSTTITYNKYTEVSYNIYYNN